MAERVEISEPSEPVRYWLEQIEGAQKDHDNWHQRGKDVVKRYLDEKQTSIGASASHKMNILWSNVETVKPALYAKDPNPKVQRRFRDKDPIGKWAAIVLERSASFGFDAYDRGYAIRNAVADYLLPGRGQIWVSYKPTFAKDDESLEWECTEWRYIHWKDFLHNPARTWAEVWWVAKAEYLSKEECKAQGISKEIIAQLTFAEKKDGESEDKGQRTKKVKVWEIWCKPKNEVVFVSKGCPELLKKPAPPGIKLENFFPCPRPLTTTCTTDSIIPTPDFCQYQNQADEIDRLTQKINLLTEALRVVGLYDSAQEHLQNLFASVGENKMIPVASWAQFAQNGGMEGAVAWLPLKDVIETLRECYNARDQAKAVMYEITGISDIVRGASDPNETLGAQQIKTQWGALRIRDRQAEVQRFVRDAIRIDAEIIAEHFSLDTLKTMSNAPLLMAQEKQALQQKQQLQQQAQQMAAANPQEAQALLQAQPQLGQLLQPLSLDELQRLREPAWEEVYSLLQDQKLRSFRIDIETDSTIHPDEVEEKAARSEFITAITGMVTAWAPIIMQAPQSVPLFGELLLFGARAFKAAETLESAIEEMVDSLNQQQLLPPQPAPEDPALAFQKKQHDDEMGFREKEMQAKNETEIKKVEASRPKIEDASGLAPALGPLFAAMQEQQQQNAQTLQQGMLQGFALLQQALQQPRQVSVQRGQDGKIIGGMAQPVMQ